MSYFKIKIILFFVIYSFAVQVHAENDMKDYIADFLADFMDQLKGPNKILILLGWNGKGTLINISKTLSRKFISHVLLSKFHFIDYDLINENRVFVMNMSCEGSVKFISDSLRRNLFDSKSTWVIFGEVNKIKSHNFYFPINSLVYVVESSKSLHFYIKVICKYSRGYDEYDEVDVAEWQANIGFLYFNQFYLIANRTDLMGNSIRVSYVLDSNDSLDHLWDYRDIHVDKITKANYVIICYLLQFVNASKVDVWTDVWGYRNEVTKLYNGMYGDLMLDRADIAGTPGFIQLARLEQFKFIPPTSPAKIFFLFQAPPLSFTSNVFIRPFTVEVWGIFLFLIILSGVLIYIVAVLERKWDIRAENHRRKAVKPNPVDVVLLQCATLTQRDSTFELKSNSGKILLYCICVLCLYMYTGFSGYILVLLQSTSDSITDITSLYNSKMDMGVEDNSYNRHYFTTPNEQCNETYRTLIYENRVAPKNNWFAPRQGIERVREGFFAFHVELGLAYSLVRETFTESEKCKIKTTKTIFNAGDTFVAVPTNSVYTDIFLVGRIIEVGLQKREHQKFFATKPQCIGRQGNYDSVRLLDCYFPFLILGFGFLISVLILIIEMFTNTGHSQRN